MSLQQCLVEIQNILRGEASGIIHVEGDLLAYYLH